MGKSIVREQKMIILSFLILTAVSYGGKSTPTGNDKRSFDFDSDFGLAGTWIGVSSTNPEITDEAAGSTTLVLRADGTQNTNFPTEFGELTISLRPVGNRGREIDHLYLRGRRDHFRFLHGTRRSPDAGRGREWLCRNLGTIGGFIPATL